MMALPTLWTAGDVAQAVGASQPGAWQATGVSIDSRTLVAGDLFIALSGPNFDGHDYVASAFKRGAAAAVVTRCPDDCDADAPLIMVGDTTRALEQLGIAARNRMRGRVIAVTGSVGKTSTKEMLRLALSDQGVVAVTQGNLNNHWGLPLSLARMGADTDFGVFELGMNHPGEIRALTKMARPHVAVITAIEPAHTEFFESVEQIADAKAEIFEGLESGGVAVLKRDGDFYNQLVEAATTAGVERVLDFGTDPQCTVCAHHIKLEPDHSDVEAMVNGEVIHYRLGAPGEHLVKNSLAALAAVVAAGGEVVKAAHALSEFRPPKGRGSCLVVALGAGDMVLIDESYNASPASMRAAMAVAGRMIPTNGGRRIAVLGDMLELGENTIPMHLGLLASLRDNAFDLVFTSGQHTMELWEALPAEMRGGHSISPDKLSMVVSSAVRPGDVVMVKGSLGSRIGAVVDALLALDTTEQSNSSPTLGG